MKKPNGHDADNGKDDMEDLLDILAQDAVVTAGTTHAIAQTLSPGKGRGLPDSSVVLEPTVSARREDVERRLDALDLNGIWRTMEGMTGHRPSLRRFDVRVYDDAAHEQKQAAINMSAQLLLDTSESGDRIVLRPSTQNHPDALVVNDSFLTHQPREARGVAFHELGHVWTQAMLMHPEAYSEGLAELFRSAAEMRESAGWEQSCGIAPYQVLHGAKEPRLVAAMKCDVPAPIEISSRYVVCKRLIDLLGGLDERVLHGIAKACDVPNSPAPVRPLLEILTAIERETGTKGFADAFLNDPVLRPGNLDTGKRAFAFRNAAGNYMMVKCFEVTDAAPLHGQSRKTFADPRSVGSIRVDNANFHMQGPQVRNLPYSLRLIHPRGIEMRVAVQGGDFIFTPEKIMEFGKQSGASWPSGTTRVEFTMDGERPVMLDHAIDIPVAEHAALCAKHGLPVR